MKLYLDWNVLNGLKKEQYEELKNIIKNDKSIFVLYSTAHISDIANYNHKKDTNSRNIEEDLNFISDVTKNLCLFNNGKEIIMGFQNPFDLFDDQLDSNKLLKNLSFDTLFSSDKINEENRSLVEALKNIPLDLGYSDLSTNPDFTKHMDDIFPDLSKDFSLSGLFDSFRKMLENLNEKEGYKDLKNHFNSLEINQGKLTSPKYNPFDVIGEAYSKLKTESPFEKDYIELGKNAPLWFDKLCHDYLTLDMHGYHSDKVNVKGKKKKTFNNPTQDAFHTAFATTCEVYITNDNKNYKKAKALFEHSNINTKVFKPHEFSEYYTDNIQKSNFDKDWNKLINLLESNSFKPIEEEDDEVYFSFISDYHFFKYFNKISIIETNNPQHFKCVFRKVLPSNCLGVAYEEVIPMINLISDQLGADNNGQKHFRQSEVDENNNWQGRSWSFDNIQLELIHFDRYFQFYIDHFKK